jgi:hypothetical protein
MQFPCDKDRPVASGIVFGLFVLGLGYTFAPVVKLIIRAVF